MEGIEKMSKSSSVQYFHFPKGRLIIKSTFDELFSILHILFFIIQNLCKLITLVLKREKLRHQNLEKLVKIVKLVIVRPRVHT